MFELPLRVLVVSECAVQTPRLVACLGELQVLAEPVGWQDAGARLRAADFDALLMDYRPDHPPCSRLLENLRNGETELPVIALVDASPDGDEHEVLEAGATDFLLREPMDALLLERALRYSLERCESQRRLQALQRVDALTGIANRSECLRLLDRATRRALQDERRLAVLVLNIDGFRKFNADFGEETGDWLIAGLAARLQAGMRRSDVLARIGADEFAVILPDIGSTADLAQVARKLLDAVAEPFALEDRAIVLQASLGIAVCPEAGEDAGTLIQHADMAMRHAKASGEGGYRFYADSLGARLQGEARLEADIRQALADGDFVLFYQPRVDLDSGAIVGLEALIRWQHPERGLLGPMEFIPFAERSRQIIPLGYWVVAQACRDMMQMQAAGLPPVQVAVNLSFEQFRDRHFIRTITEIVAASGIAPEWLEFELTETAVMTHPRKADRAMRLLNALGMRFSLDDFGTGYSSFAHLQRLPIACLKIDRSFVQNVTTNAGDAVIVRAMINLAHSLELSVVAEGAEAADQVDFLRRHACDQMQGYVFSRPLPLDQVCSMMAADRRLLM